MSKFRGTFIFLALVVVVAGLALHEYKKSEDENGTPDQERLYKDLNIDGVATFSFNSPEQSFNLKLEKDEWRLTAPVEDVADEDTVRSALRDLFNQNVETVESNGAVDWSKYGLDTPAAEFHFELASGGSHKVVVGKIRTYDQGFYLRRDDGSQLLVAGKDWENNQKNTYRAFITKRLRLPKADLLSARFVSHKKGKSWDNEFLLKNGNWVYAKDETLRLEQSAVLSATTGFKFLKAADILSDTKTPADLSKSGLNHPDLTVTLTYADKSTAQMDLKYPDQGDAAFVASTNQAIYKVGRSQVDKFFKSLDELRDKEFPFRFGDEKLDQVEISKDNGKSLQKFAKNDSIWELEGKPKAQVLQSDVDDLISGLKKIKASRFLPRKGSAPSLEHFVTLYGPGSKEIFRLNFGRVFKDDSKREMYTVQTNLFQDFVAVDRASIDNLINKAFEAKK